MDKKSLAERALELSLDDYIRESNIYISPMLKQPRIETDYEKTRKNSRNGANKFTESDDEEMEEEDVSLNDRKGTLSVNNFDLRDKLQANAPSEDNFPKAKSANWRLMHPNVTADNRPAGMAPLIPSELLKGLEPYKLNERKEITHENFQAKPENAYHANQKFHTYNIKSYQNRRQNCNNNNNDHYRQNCNSNNNNNHYRQNYNNNNHYRQNCNNNNNNHRNIPYRNLTQSINMIHNNKNNTPNNNIQRNFSWNRQNRSSTGFPYNFRRMVESKFPDNVTVETDMPNENVILNNNLQNIQATLLKPQHPPVVCDPTPTEMVLKTGLNALSNLSANNTIPLMASKLLEIFNRSSKPEPKYDMKIQKAIHVLQNKPMIYRCPDGEIISSDGPGIRNTPVTPNSTGITLNQRFA